MQTSLFMFMTEGKLDWRLNNHILEARRIIDAHIADRGSFDRMAFIALIKRFGSLRTDQILDTLGMNITNEPQ